MTLEEDHFNAMSWGLSWIVGFLVTKIYFLYNSAVEYGHGLHIGQILPCFLSMCVQCVVWHHGKEGFLSSFVESQIKWIKYSLTYL